MNGPGAQSIRIPLSFRGDGSHQAALARDDAADGSTVGVESVRQDTILELPTGGGFLERFSR